MSLFKNNETRISVQRNSAKLLNQVLEVRLWSKAGGTVCWKQHLSLECQQNMRVFLFNHISNAGVMTL